MALLDGAADRLARNRKLGNGRAPSYGWQFIIRAFNGDRLIFTRHCAYGVDLTAERRDLVSQYKRGRITRYELVTCGPPSTCERVTFHQGDRTQ